MTRICMLIFMAVLSGAVSAIRTAASSGRSDDQADDGDSLLVMFWNLENMFDYRDSGTGESDVEFSSFGQRRWTKGRFYAKCNSVAKAVLWTADRYGRLPDVIGVAEVENAFVVRSIISATALKKYGYRMVHFDSPDRRGIDVALLYREEVFEKQSARPCHIYEQGLTGGRLMETRDILLVSLKHLADGHTYHFLVNHHPSKYGGAEASEGRRIIAMRTLRLVCDSLVTGDRDVMIIAMGDFNDTPSRGPFDILCGKEGRQENDGRNGPDAERCGVGPGRNVMINLGCALEAAGEGTIRYGGKWELIDMFIVSCSLAGGASGRDDGKGSRSRMEVVKVPFLMARDNTHVGDRPFRTYSGPRYIGGVSDHCPIILTIKPQ